MSTDRKPLLIADLRGGRNGADPPLSLPENQCVEALNVDFYQSTLGRKRGGAVALSLVGGPFAVGVVALIRHVPGATDTAAELWGLDGNSNVGRYAGGGWSIVTPTDTPLNAIEVYGASHNGKLFLCYDSAVNRLHCWDGTALRRAGLGTPAAPTVANSAGAGTYAATIRYYKVAYTVQAAGVTVRRSELSAAQSFTPDGAHDAAVVTKPATIGEGETHWELYASTAAAGPYVCIATTAVATTTYSDSTAPASYTGASAPTAGTNTVPTSAKFIISDGNRLLLGGAWETGGYHSRVWYTAVQGASGVGNDERIPTTTTQNFYVDLDENDGGGLTGFGGPMDGSVFAFKYRQIWKLVPTKLSSAPYRPIPESKVIGAVEQAAIVLAEDEAGRPSLVFWSHRGPYRLGANGLEYMGHDIEDVIATVNLGATWRVAHGVYHPEKHQVWFWVSVGSDSLPTVKLVFDTKLGRSTTEGVRYGWTKHDGDSAAAYCSCLFANTLGATVSRDLKPHIGRIGGGTPFVWKCDTGTTDAGTAYQAYVRTKPYAPAGLLNNTYVDDVQLLAKVGTGVTVTVTVNKDYGAATASGTALLTAAGSETRVQKKVDVGASQCGVVQFQIGDGSALDSSWTLDALVVPATRQEAR